MSQQDTIKLELPAKHQYLYLVSALLEAFLTSHSLHEQVIYNIQLGVQEVCANVVDHAYKEITEGLIKITIRLEKSNILIVELYDYGKVFDPTTIKTTSLDGQPHVRGYGLQLIKSLFDDVIYENLSDCNRWTVKKQL